MESRSRRKCFRNTEQRDRLGRANDRALQGLVLSKENKGKAPRQVSPGGVRAGGMARSLVFGVRPGMRVHRKSSGDAVLTSFC